MNKFTFKIVNDGEELECKIIKIIPSNDFSKNYIIYECNNDIYASRYEIVNKNLKLYEIESEEEYDYLDSYLNNEVV